jgi:hypothetical protein
MDGVQTSLVTHSRPLGRSAQRQFRALAGADSLFPLIVE